VLGSYKPLVTNPSTLSAQLSSYENGLQTVCHV
jgi:hypothetical protein